MMTNLRYARKAVVILAMGLIVVDALASDGGSPANLFPGHVEVSTAPLCKRLQSETVLDVAMSGDEELWILSAKKPADDNRARSFSISRAGSDSGLCEHVLEWAYETHIRRGSAFLVGEYLHVCVAGERNCSDVPRQNCLEHRSDILIGGQEKAETITWAPEAANWRIKATDKEPELQRLWRRLGGSCHGAALGEGLVVTSTSGELVGGRVVPQAWTSQGFLEVRAAVEPELLRRRALPLQIEGGEGRPWVYAPQAFGLGSKEAATWWYESNHTRRGGRYREEEVLCLTVLDEALSFQAPARCYETFHPYVGAKLVKSGRENAGFVQVRLGPNREEWVLEGLLVPAGSLPRIPGRKDASGWVRDLPRQVFLGVSEDKLLFGSVAGECSEADCTMSLGADFDAAR